MDAMSIASTANKVLADLLDPRKAAANADVLRSASADDSDPAMTATGWDSFEVWKKFIKEARDKRQP